MKLIKTLTCLAVMLLAGCGIYARNGYMVGQVRSVIEHDATFWCDGIGNAVISRGHNGDRDDKQDIINVSLPLSMIPTFKRAVESGETLKFTYDQTSNIYCTNSYYLITSVSASK